LNVIRSEKINPDIVNKLKGLTNGKARLAKELIEYKPEYEAAMNFVFGNVVSLRLIFINIVCG
jgi:chromosome segregation ATPase